MESLNPKGDKNTHTSGNAKKVAVAIKVVNISACVLGPSGVRVLPLAAGISEGGHYWSERSACADLDCWHKRRWPLF